MKIISKVIAGFDTANKFLKIFHCIQAAMEAFKAEAIKQGLHDIVPTTTDVTSGDKK